MKKPTKPKKRTQISKRAGIQDTPMRYYHALKERVEKLEGLYSDLQDDGLVFNDHLNSITWRIGRIWDFLERLTPKARGLRHFPRLEDKKK